MRAYRYSLAVLALVVGCADEFDDFNLVKGYRLLGLAADPPSLRQDEVSTLSALVTADEAEFEWSWCPLAVGAAGVDGCATTQSELQALADETLGEGVITIPPFELGTGATATFDYELPSGLFEAFCGLILQGGNDLPDGVDVPDCTSGYDIQIRLATRGEVDGETSAVIGVRDLELLFDEAVMPNANPVILGMTATAPVTGESVVLDPAAATPLERGTLYELELDVDPASAEQFSTTDPAGNPIEAVEQLTVTWYREGGEFDKNRTGFIDGSVPFETLLANEWTPPELDEVDRDLVKLYAVIRDSRGGTGFLVREVELVAP